MRQDQRLAEAIVIAFIVACSLLWANKAWSSEIVDTNRLAVAIGKAENSWGYKPYGILKDYCKAGDPDGQCLKGCKQTINKWKQKLVYSDVDGFLRKFAEIYAPSKAHKLNKNWFRNVRYHYNKAK